MARGSTQIGFRYLSEMNKEFLVVGSSISIVSIVLVSFLRIVLENYDLVERGVLQRLPEFVSILGTTLFTCILLCAGGVFGAGDDYNRRSLHMLTLSVVFGAGGSWILTACVTIGLMDAVDRKTWMQILDSFPRVGVLLWSGIGALVVLCVNVRIIQRHFDILKETDRDARASLLPFRLLIFGLIFPALIVVASGWFYWEYTEPGQVGSHPPAPEYDLSYIVYVGWVVNFGVIGIVLMFLAFRLARQLRERSANP